MPITYVKGDVLLTRAPALAIAHNARGAVPFGELYTALQDRYPAAFAAFRKAARAGRLKAGALWVWRESQPQLVFLIVQQTAVGMIRARYVDSVMQQLARDWQQQGLTAVALARLGSAQEWITLQSVVDYWLHTTELPVVAYTAHRPGIHAPEPWNAAPDD